MLFGHGAERQADFRERLFCAVLRVVGKIRHLDLLRLLAERKHQRDGIALFHFFGAQANHFALFHRVGVFALFFDGKALLCERLLCALPVRADQIQFRELGFRGAEAKRHIDLAVFLRHSAGFRLLLHHDIFFKLIRILPKLDDQRQVVRAEFLLGLVAAQRNQIRHIGLLLAERGARFGLGALALRGCRLFP